MERFPYPSFIEFIPKLPKGLKWSDGVKFRFNREWYPMSKTCWFLPHGDNMYTKDLIYPMCYDDMGAVCYDPDYFSWSLVGHKVSPSIAVIHNFHSLTANDVIFPMLDVLNLDQQESICKVWRQHGLECGMVIPTLRKLIGG